MQKSDALKYLVGNNNAYYDLVDAIVLEQLQEIVETITQAGWDPFETVDNKAQDLSAFLRVIKYYMTHADYQQYIKGLGVKVEATD